MARAPVLAPTEFLRKATQLLSFEEAQIARRPIVPLSDDPEEERRRIVEDRRHTRILWHATTEGAENAPLSEWDDCGSESKTAGSWPKGSGWYLLVCDENESIRLLTHYRVSGDREDSSRNSDPSRERARAEADSWARARVEANDQEVRIRDLRARLDAAQVTISTHLTTIAQKDARILALETASIPQAAEPHWATPIALQGASFLEEARPLLQPLLHELAPTVRAAVKEHFSAGAFAAALQQRLADAQPAYQALTDAITNAGGFALRLPEPTPAQAASHHCPHGGCDAERDEPCMDGEHLADEPHPERIALARMPRELKTAIKKAGAEIVYPGLLLADDPAVIAAFHALARILEMEEWERAQAQAETDRKSLDATPPPLAAEPEPPVVVPPPPPAKADPIPDADFEEPPTGDPSRTVKPSASIRLDSPEAIAGLAEKVRERKAEIERAQARTRVRADEINARKPISTPAEEARIGIEKWERAKARADEINARKPIDAPTEDARIGIKEIK